MRIGPSSGVRVLALVVAGALLATALVSTGVAGSLPEMHSVEDAASDGGTGADWQNVVPVAGAGTLPLNSVQAWGLLLAWLATPLLAGVASLRPQR
jgi:hypothetical protein